MDWLEVLLDALLDSLRLAPFLLATVLLMEWLEHRAGEKFTTALQKAGPLSAPVGALLGLVPQCGFSAACAHLFNGGLVSAGTLAAVFLSTSDEALPILISNPEGLPAVWRLILVKLLVAILAGVLLDIIWPPSRQKAAYAFSAPEHHCQCGRDPGVWQILWAAVKRTLSILLFVFLFTLALNALIALIGEDRLAALMLPGFFQPLLAGLLGFIPNCAASVLLTQLYLDGMITFGSAVAGLCTASGVGLLVLLRGKRGAKTYAKVLLTVYAAAVSAGLILQLL